MRKKAKPAEQPKIPDDAIVSFLGAIARSQRGISEKMKSVLRKVDAAREAHFAQLRAKGAEDRARMAKAAPKGRLTKSKPKKRSS